MDGIGRDESRPWASWGDLVVVLTALLLGLLGLIRHVRADEGVLDPVVTVPEDVGAGDCCPRSCDPRISHVLDPWGVDPVWSGRAEALMLWRDNPQGLPLFENAGGGPALNAADFGSGMAAGPRFTLFRHTGDQGAIEFNYFRVQSFTAEKNLAGEGGYREIGHGIYCCPDTATYDTVNGRLSGGLQSFELNRRFPTNGRWQWLTGFRWVQWQENVFIESSAAGGQLQNTFDSSVFDDLYGWQFGADSILWGSCKPFRIEGLGKAGVYYNNAVQHSARTTTTTSPPTELFVATGVGQVSFVGEIGLTAVYDVYDWLSLRAGYSAFWLGGIATATNQLSCQDLCPGQPIVGRTFTGGSVVMQGITLGLEARY